MVGLGGDDQPARIEPLRFGGERKGDAPDIGAAVGEHRDRRLEGTQHLGVGVVEEHLLGNPQTQPGQTVIEGVAQSMRRAPGGGGIVGVGALQCLVEQRAIGDRARQRSDRVETVRERPDTGAAHLADGGLQAADTAQRRRDAHRAAGVGAERRGQQTRRGGDRGTAARAARCAMFLAPRVVRRADIGVQTDTAIGELHGVRLAEQHHAGRRQASDGRRVAAREIVREQAATGAGCHAGDVEQILRGIGHAEQRCVVLAAGERFAGSACRGAGALGAECAEGMQRSVQPFDAREQMLGHLEG